MSAADGLDRVVILAREVTQLRHRLAQIDGERVRIEGQIAERMKQIALAAIGAVSPGDLPTAVQPAQTEPMALSAAILYVINQSPGRVFTALEIAGMLEMTNRRGRSAIRTHLSRMAKDGRVAKLAFGKYRAR
jgi:hypothetical protein